MFLTSTRVSRLCKAFVSNSSANIKLSKTQLHKTGQSGGFLGRLWGPLLKTGLPWIGNLLMPSAKGILVLLELTAAAAATDFATLIISDEEMNDVMKIVKSHEESGLLIKGVSEVIKNEAKEQKGGFLSILLGTLGASLLGNLLTGKGTIRAGEGTFRAGEHF